MRSETHASDLPLAKAMVTNEPRRSWARRAMRSGVALNSSVRVMPAWSRRPRSSSAMLKGSAGGSNTSSPGAP